jgi:hypothetical protein
MLVLLMVGTYEVRRLDDLATIRFRHSSVIRVIASAIIGATVLVLLMRGIYKVPRLHGLGWHDIHTKFHKDRLKHSKVVGGE